MGVYIIIYTHQSVYYAVFTVEFFTAIHFLYALAIIILYGNETVPWFDALIRMERKTNRHRNRACLAQCFCGANNKLAKRDIYRGKKG